MGNSKEYYTAYNRAYYHKHKRKIRKQQQVWEAERARIVRSLKERPCMDCGIQYPHYVMDWDHRDPTQKVMGVSRMTTRVPLEALLTEIEKCDLVCANCHRERTHGPKV